MIPLGITVFTIGYLLGSIPFAVIICRIRGVDIFKVGSGNPGATNVKRAVSKTAGNICFVLDLLKGFLAAGWIYLLQNSNDSDLSTLSALGLIAAILGHRFSVFLKFRGGKSVATTMGGLTVIMPVVFAIGISIWALTFILTRYVFFASLLFALSLPLSAYFLNEPKVYQILSLGLLLFLTFSHSSNINRFFKGKENNFRSEKN